MPYIAPVLLSYSIFIVVALLLFRRNYLPAEILPFSWLILVGATNEIISTVVAARAMSTHANNNFYQLIEALLLLWLFRKWGAIASGRTFFLISGLLLFAGWLLELLLGGFKHDLVFFSMVYSFAAVVLSVRSMSAKQLPPSLVPFRRSVLLICSCFVVYFSSRILLDSVWYLGLGLSDAFRYAVYYVMAFINCIINLCYALAILWIRPKQKYSSLLY